MSSRLWCAIPADERKSIQNLEDVRLKTIEGGEVPLAVVANARPARGPASIHRVDRKRSIKISADVDRAKANANEVVSLFTDEVLAGLSAKFPGVSWDYLGEQKDQKDSISEMGVKFVFALLGIYVLMAIPSEIIHSASHRDECDSLWYCGSCGRAHPHGHGPQYYVTVWHYSPFWGCC